MSANPISEVKAHHTPGPWHIEHRPESHRLYVCAGGRSLVYFQERKSGARRGWQPQWYGFQQDEIANVHLIAAAPELLAAAKTVLADLHARIDAGALTGKLPIFTGIADLASAISKATGGAQ